MKKIADAIRGIALIGIAPLIASAGAFAASPVPGNDSAAQPVGDGPEVLTTDEAAQLLRLEAARLVALAQSGQIPGRLIDNEWRFSRVTLLGWLAGYRQGLALAEESRAPQRTALAPPPGARPVDRQDSTAIVGRGLESAEQVAGQSDADPLSAPIGTAPKGRTASEVFLRDQRVLLAPNELTIDFALFYARNDDLILGFTGNDPTLGLLESESLGGVLVGRYALGRATEVFATTSYQNRRSTIIANNQAFRIRSRDDIGDIGLGIRHTVVDEGPGRPDVIVTLEGSIPTGDNRYSLGGGLTLVKSFDPSVLYASFEFRHGFGRELENSDRLRSSNRIETELGYAFALNDTIILNMALSTMINLEPTLIGDTFPQNEVFNLRTGLTARLSRRLFVQPSVTYRLNGPGNSVVFGLNFPYTFGL